MRHIQNGREICVILLTVVGDDERNKKYIYTIWGLTLTVFSEKGVCCFICSRRTAYMVRDNATIFTSVSLSYKEVISFQLIFYVFEVYVK